MYRFIDEAAWHNNHVPGVGQTIPYASYPTMPEWVGAMEIALRELRQQPGDSGHIQNCRVMRLAANERKVSK